MRALKSAKHPKILALPLTIVTIGLLSILILAQSLPSLKIEAESGSALSGASVASDTTASGGSYLAFGSTTTPPPPSGSVRPTRDNTGPRHPLTDITPSQFYSSRTCNKQRIVGNVDFDKQTMFGQTFTLTDCEVTGRIFVYLRGGGATLSINEMPIINLDYVDVNGGIYTLNAVKLTTNHTYVNNGGQWGVKDVWAPFISADAPYTFMNSVFYNTYETQPSHTEALHVGDYGIGYKFINVAFEQQGGSLTNSGVTATINFHGDNALFDGCWFIFDGSVPAYYTAYLDAKNSIVRNSYFERGAAGYVYPDTVFKPTFQNNFDFTTGQSISL